MAERAKDQKVKETDLLDGLIKECIQILQAKNIVKFTFFINISFRTRTTMQLKMLGLHATHSRNNLKLTSLLFNQLFLEQLTRCLKILNRNLIFWFLLDRWLECLLKKHEELIPTVSKTQVMVDLYWKCYAYGDELKPHIEFLDGIMLSSTRDIAPSCVENVDELIERQVRSMMRGWPMDIFEGIQHRSASCWTKFKVTKNLSFVFVEIAHTQHWLTDILDCWPFRAQIMGCHLHSNSVHGLTPLKDIGHVYENIG